ncbi:hypothetical protein [Allokutzneria sp. NRRL B-24872]|uniref:hypothetical protein n=1 Tax=Allokutzneria sp. NRRL B-24872 TaxID=1137961 RepID=UPI000A361D95|nr:hypothetical protein [Allokutzneria sp. NRRL B-24872]
MSAGEIRVILTVLAGAVEHDIGAASAHREAVEQMQAQLSSAWAGSLRDEAATALAHTHTAIEKIVSGIDRLHHCSSLLRGAAAEY